VYKLSLQPDLEIAYYPQTMVLSWILAQDEIKDQIDVVVAKVRKLAYIMTKQVAV
jgi:hypothetical protein